MDYSNFSAVGLAVDAAFIDWVLRPDAASTAFWEDHLARHPDQADVMAEARQLVLGWRIDPPVPSAGSMEAVWRNIQADIAGTERSAVRRVRLTGNRSRFAGYAAGLLGLLVLAAAYLWFSHEQTTTRYATGKGETKTVTLPDGSTVVLAANSSLAIVGDWAPRHPRELALRGEAFFSVTHQPNHQKFIVKTPDNLRVEVLGTTFTITERPTDTQVVLNSGKVALYVNQDAQPLLMKPGELVDVPKTRQQPVVRRQVVPEVYSAWKDNQFVFDDTSLGEIADQIERDFGTTVQFADETLKNQRVTLHLPNRDLPLLLTSLAEIHDLTIDRHGNHILIAHNPNAQ